MKSDSTSKEARLHSAGFLHLPNDWSIMEINDLLSNDRGISVGVMYPGAHDELGIPLIKASDLNGSLINPTPPFFISPAKHKEYSRTALEGGELLLTLVGAVGQCAIVSSQMAGWNVARAVAVIRLKNPNDAPFVRLCLLSPPIQHLMQVWSNTTVQMTLNLKEIRQIPIPWPPPGIRHAISKAIGALDDKIELNRRMNATLEAMAQTLFRAWFVDFEPVKAKAAGLAPVGLDEATTALFPSEFEDSELGLIPKGWRVSPLPEEIDYLEGPGLRNWQYRDEGMKFLNIRCIADGDLEISKANAISEEEFDQKYKHFALKENDLVISTSGTLGRLAIVRADHLPLMLNTSIIRMRGRGSVGLAYTWGFFSSDYFLDEMFASSAGSVQLNFGPMHLRRIEMLRPPDDVLDSFERIARTLLTKILENRKQTRTLAQTREALLPRLISGQLRVSTE